MEVLGNRKISMEMPRLGCYNVFNELRQETI